MNHEIKVQKVGLTIVACILLAGAIVITLFFRDMSLTALGGASPKYRPHFPTVPATDITQAPQCKEGYDKKWIGCQSLAE